MHNKSPDNPWDPLSFTTATYTYSKPNNKFQYISVPIPSNIRLPADDNILEYNVVDRNVDVSTSNDAYEENSVSILEYLVSNIVKKHIQTSSRRRSIKDASIALKVYKYYFYHL